MRNALLCVALALTLACAALPLAFAQPTGTPVPSPAETASPQPSQTPTPSDTPEPTATPTTPPSDTPEPAQSLTPTAEVAVLTPTPVPAVIAASPVPPSPTPSELDCKLIWQSPSIGAYYNVQEKFGAGWKLRNIGTATWQAGSVQFTYLGGYRLSHDFEEPLTTSVAPGQEIILSVPMKAPNRPNLYTTHWGLRQGNSFFCRLTVTILVQP